MKLQKQGWRHGEIGLGVLIDGVDLGFIQKLDAGNGYTVLDRSDDRVDSAVDVWKRAYG